MLFLYKYEGDDVKIDRLLGIIIYLMSHEKVQAKELADLFEVSVRTIYRDIETINLARIPVITYQGTGGGIGIAEGYRLDKNIFTNDEIANIVTALNGLATSHNDPDSKVLIEKFRSIIPAAKFDSFNLKTQQFYIDLSSWDKNVSLNQKVKTLKAAIEAARTVLFSYYNSKGEMSKREVEPHTLVLKGQNWYVYGFCRKRTDFRLFRLSRIKDIEMSNSIFERREVSFDKLPWEKEWHKPEKLVKLRLAFDKKVQHLVEEWFGIIDVELDNRGRIIVEVSWPEDDWLYGFLLSFGSNVEVLEPVSLRGKIYNMAEDICSIYKETL